MKQVTYAFLGAYRTVRVHQGIMKRGGQFHSERPIAVIELAEGVSTRNGDIYREYAAEYATPAYPSYWEGR